MSPREELANDSQRLWYAEAGDGGESCSPEGMSKSPPLEREHVRSLQML